MLDPHPDEINIVSSCFKSVALDFVSSNSFRAKQNDLPISLNWLGV